MIKFFMTIFVIIVYSFTFIFSLNLNSIQQYVYPTKYTDISSDYGYRNINGNLHFHGGIDFLSPYNTEVYATCDGTVFEVGFSNVYGIYVIILHDDGFKSLYGHLNENLSISTKNTVKCGDVIGYVGPKYLSNGRLNGMTTGPHLHFSIYDNNGNLVNPKTKIS